MGGGGKTYRGEGGQKLLSTGGLLVRFCPPPFCPPPPFGIPWIKGAYGFGEGAKGVLVYLKQAAKRCEGPALQ